MDPPTQKVLNWLHRVLQAQYEDVNRTYADAAQTLTQYKSLRPSTEVYTFEDGRSALLLRLAGTLPVTFRGAVYAFPVSIWVPYEYPRAAPVVLITPSKGMRVRPGQHVSAEGRVYHPFLAGWRPDISNVLGLLSQLQDSFAHEPPVVAVQEPVQQGMPPGVQNGGPPPRPPLPPELDHSAPLRENRQSMTSPPPPQVPLKPYQEQRQGTPQLADGPPVPPRPGSYYGSSRPESVQQDPSLGRPPSTTYNPRYSQPPPLPTQPSWQQVPPAYPGAQAPPPQQPLQGYPQHPQHAQFPPQQHQQPPPGAPQPPYEPHQPYPTNHATPMQQHPQHPQQLQQHQQQPPQQPYPPTHLSSHPPHLQQPPPKPAPPPDLLSDALDPPTSLSTASLPAPPIPPNPEKDALLRTLSQTLTSRLHAALHTNSSAQHSLAVQHQAMEAAQHNLTAEQIALQAQSGDLGVNAQLLGGAMRDADACVARARTQSAPGIDEALVAPTVVGQQLYDLVADAQACAGARDVLARALDRGRIAPESWVRAVRGLAREEFLKRALVDKAARGMGLRVEEHRGLGAGEPQGLVLQQEVQSPGVQPVEGRIEGGWI